MALDPTSLVDFCNQNSPRAQPRIIRTSTRLRDVAHPARAGLEETSRRGWGPVRFIDHRLQGSRPGHRGSALRRASLLGYRAAPVVRLSPDLTARVRTLRPVQDSRSTPAEVSRARGRKAKPARPLPCLRPRAPHACRSWPTRAHGSLSPSRSTRTPPVAGPRRYRLEIRHRWSARPKPDRPPRRSRHAATLLGSPCGGAPCGASGREPLRVPRTARFRAPPAASHPLSRMVPTNQASCAALIAQRRLSHPARLGHDLLAQAAFPGPRVASPDDPRRTSRSAAPEVHSVAELPPFTTLDLRPEPLLGQDVIHSL